MKTIIYEPNLGKPYSDNDTTNALVSFFDNEKAHTFYFSTTNILTALILLILEEKVKREDFKFLYLNEEITFDDLGYMVGKTSKDLTDLEEKNLNKINDIRLEKLFPEDKK